MTASEILKNGGVVAIPTEAVYGLHCDPRNETALRKILRLKKRDSAKGFILIASAWAQLQPYMQALPADIEQTLKASWPGPVTWVVPAKASVSPLITGTFETVAVRITNHPLIKQICTEFGGALVSTSANISDSAPAKSVQAVKLAFHDDIDYIVEGQVGTLEKPTAIYEALTGKQLR